MLFNSFEYLVFLPVVFLLYWFVFCQLRQQNLLIVMVSYVSYGGDDRFLFLIAQTTLLSFLSGLGIERRKFAEPNGGKFYAVANIAVNLIILSISKYYNFFAESLAAAFSGIGIALHLTMLRLVLPVGISFYTFQALSYTVDIYWGKLKATDDIQFFP